MCHEDAAAAGQSEQVDIDDDVMTHFISFVSVAGNLYELDGRKSQPINHGPCDTANLLEGACGVVKQFMERDPEELRFTMVALAAHVEE